MPPGIIFLRLTASCGCTIVAGLNDPALPDARTQLYQFHPDTQHDLQRWTSLLNGRNNAAWQENIAVLVKNHRDTLLDRQYLRISECVLRDFKPGRDVRHISRPGLSPNAV